MHFVIGDYVGGMLVGALTALGVRAAVWPGMDMVLAMLIGMVIGMVIHLVLELLLTPLREVPAYVAAQVGGAFVGVAVADVMFGEPIFSLSRHIRQGPAQLLSEFVATFGLLMVIWGCSRLRSAAVPFAVGAYITAAYWFTASTSFANPAVTLVRSVTDTFAGIRPADVPGFIAAQVVGAVAATALFRWLIPTLPQVAPEVVAAHIDYVGTEEKKSAL